MPGDPQAHAVSQQRRRELRADCARCAGLCCVAPAFSVSADFAITKAAGKPCPNLRPDFRCGVHDELRQRGFAGCAAYDCFGAGQKVVQDTFGGQDWRGAPHLAEPMFAAFTVMRQVHELLWYLSEALALAEAAPLREELGNAWDRTEQLTRADADTLAGLDVAARRDQVGSLLLRVSELARAVAGKDRKDLRGADLTGAGLAGTDLRGASLRGARLIGADLHGADLRRADLLGADLRGADLRGADLTGCLFLVQPQVDAARGDASARLPVPLVTPPHWRPAG